MACRRDLPPSRRELILTLNWVLHGGTLRRFAQLDTQSKRLTATSGLGNNLDRVDEGIIYDRHEGQFDLAQGASLNVLKGFDDRLIAPFRHDVEVFEQR